MDSMPKMRAPSPWLSVILRSPAAMPESASRASSMLAHDLYTGEFLWGYQPHPQDTLDLDFCAHPIVYDADAPRLGRGDRRPCVVAGATRRERNAAARGCFGRVYARSAWKVSFVTAPCHTSSHKASVSSPGKPPSEACMTLKNEAPCAAR